MLTLEYCLSNRIIAKRRFNSIKSLTQYTRRNKLKPDSYHIYLHGDPIIFTQIHQYVSKSQLLKWLSDFDKPLRPHIPLI